MCGLLPPSLLDKSFVIVARNSEDGAVGAIRILHRSQKTNGRTPDGAEECESTEEATGKLPIFTSLTYSVTDQIVKTLF